jgi:hypothetical protein
MANVHLQSRLFLTNEIREPVQSRLCQPQIWVLHVRTRPATPLLDSPQYRVAVSNAIDHAKFYSRSHDAVIRVYDECGNMIETHEHKGEFKEW